MEKIRNLPRFISNIFFLYEEHNKPIDYSAEGPLGTIKWECSIVVQIILCININKSWKLSCFDLSSPIHFEMFCTKQIMVILEMFYLK